MGKDRKAAEAMEEAYLNVNDTKSAVAIQSAFNQKGMYGVWEWWLGQHEGLAKNNTCRTWVLAYQYAELRDKEQTLRELGEAYNERSPRLVFLQKEPPFDFLTTNLAIKHS